MSASPVILGACVLAAFGASLLGGLLPSWVHLTHTRLQTALSFIGGLMLGLALLHMIPHAAEEAHSLDRALHWALGGFLSLFFLQRVFRHHHHEVEGPGAPETSGQTGGGGPGGAPALGVNHRLSWLAVLLGMSLHSLLDGLALATAVQVEARATAEWVGLGTALAVILHKPFDALTVLTLMRAGGCGAGLRRAVNVGFALVAPLGAVLSFVGLGALVRTHHEILGCALAFCAGGFLCIACSDLLPELQFHSHDRIRLSLALLAGLAASFLIGLLEGEGHGHGHPHHHAATHGHRAYPTSEFCPGVREEATGA